MKPGERAVFYIQPEYAFGRGGSPPKVPPGTSVTFDTEIISVKCKSCSRCFSTSLYTPQLTHMSKFKIKIVFMNLHKLYQDQN